MDIRCMGHSDPVAVLASSIYESLHKAHRIFCWYSPDVLESEEQMQHRKQRGGREDA